MMHLAQAALENYNYTQDEVSALFDAVRAHNTPKNIKKNKEKADRLDNLTQRLSFVPINPFAGTDVNDSSFRPTDANVLAYAGYLFKYAAYHTDKEIPTDTLMNLLKRNASLKRLDIVEASLFSEARKIKAVDKSLVLKITQSYASSVRYNDVYLSDLNFAFGGRMSEMFKDIVTNYNYNGREARALTNILATGCEGDAYFKNMGDNVFKAYTLAQRRRSRALAKTKGKDL